MQSDNESTTNSAYRIAAPSLSARWAMLVAALAMAVSTVPYLVGFQMSNGRHFMWLGYNLDDSCVYLSWMRQAADGATRNLNLFTTDAQHGIAPNPFFWLLGTIARMTRLPLIAVYHLSRVVCGLCLLAAVWNLICTLVVDARSRMAAFLFTCFSAGLGWLPLFWTAPLPSPVDVWQPEAITFLCLYLSPLFCFSLTLQVLIVSLLFQSHRRRSIRPAIWAGLCGLVLGLSHTYDVITMSAVWIAFLLAYTVISVRSGEPITEQARRWVCAFIAGAITAPAVLYIAFQLKTETVFRQRADVLTLAPPLIWVLLGYGVTLLFATLAALRLIRSHRIPAEANEENGKNGRCITSGIDATVLLIGWAVANIACAYIHTTFQRKMLQGAHIPIAILGGIGATLLYDGPRIKRRIPSFPLYLLIVTGLLAPTNLLFALRDIQNYSANLAQTRLHRTYLLNGELDALAWLDRTIPAHTAVQPLPWVGLIRSQERTQIYTRDAALMCFLPGLIDRPMYCGHWGETPDYGLNGAGKMAELRAFGTPTRSDKDRIALLRKMKVGYIIFSQKAASDRSLEETGEIDAVMPIFRGKLPLPSYLKLVYSNADADVYEVDLPPQQ